MTTRKRSVQVILEVKFDHNKDRSSRPLMLGMKMMLEAPLEKCGAAGCRQDEGVQLMQCARQVISPSVFYAHYF
jgi:hypothetical protein